MIFLPFTRQLFECASRARSFPFNSLTNESASGCSVICLWLSPENYLLCHTKRNRNSTPRSPTQQRFLKTQCFPFGLCGSVISSRRSDRGTKEVKKSTEKILQHNRKWINRREHRIRRFLLSSLAPAAMKWSVVIYHNSVSSGSLLWQKRHSPAQFECSAMKYGIYELKCYRSNCCRKT